jgi:Lrp/AsnC family leucine-responsive transcriptional regulator
MPMDETDRKILRLLQEDGRMSNAELAERIHLSPSACLRRVRHLEQERVIEGYAMLVNQSAIGRAVNVFVEITLTNQSEDCQDAFETAVRQCPDVMECYLMSGDADYLLRIAAADANDYERIHKTYLSRLPGIARIRSNFALRPVCRNTSCPVD